MYRQIIGLAAVIGLGIAFGQPAIAADIYKPVYKARPPVPYYNWTGCYIGAHVGGGWGRKEWRDPLGPPFDIGSHDVNGWLGGGQVGCNYQFGPWVVGAEGQFSGARLTGSHPNPFDIVDQLRTRVDWLATAAARLGYAVDRTLLYAKVGGAWIRDRHDIEDAGLIEGRADTTRSGWLVGAGIEVALWANWTAKLEYNYMNFGTKTLTFIDPTGGDPPFPVDIRQHLQTVTVGLNWRFGAGPLYARN